MKPGERGRAHRPDYVLALSVFVLLSIGLIMMYSISPVLSHKLFGSTDRNYFFYGQLVNITFGVGAWIFAYSMGYQRWQKLAPALVIVSIISLLMLLIPAFSLSKNGATRWLHIASFSFQPAELLKLSLILYLATWFEKRGEAMRTFWDGLIPFGLILFFASVAVALFQRDFGSMIVLAAAAVGMFFVAGIRWDHFLVLLGGGFAAAWLAIVSFPHRLSRLTTFLDPTKDASNAGYHINQALIAVGSGGLFGLGLGKSIQVYGYLPEAANDSIFAIIAEEFGLVGSVAIVALFGLVVYRGFRIAKAAPDSFSRLVATGITLLLMFQAVVNIAAMLSLVPLTGIPLPFISYGGSSLVFTLVGVGILMNISKFTNKEATYADNRIGRRNSWPYLASSGNSRRSKVAR